MPVEAVKKQVAIAGDFNDWNPTEHVLEKRRIPIK